MRFQLMIPTMLLRRGSVGRAPDWDSSFVGKIEQNVTQAGGESMKNIQSAQETTRLKFGRQKWPVIVLLLSLVMKTHSLDPGFFAADG